jgi:hypothetical protein
VTIAEVVGEPIPSRYRVPARWRIEVRSDTGTDVGFKCAIAVDGTLQLVEAFTPYDFDFSAAKFRALFEAKTDAALNVSGYSDVGGEFRKMTAFSGSRSGQVIFDPHGSEGNVLLGSGSL